MKAGTSWCGRWAAFGMLLCLVVGQAWAETQPFLSFRTGNDVLNYCTADRETQQYGYCVGYVASAIDTHTTWWASWMMLRKPMICMPRGRTDGQLALIVVKYLKEHPEDLHRDGGWMVLSALMKAFPCSDNQ